MKYYNVVSLFNGISCTRLAMDKAKLPVGIYYSSEIDTYANGVTQKNFPDTIQIGDVSTLDERFDINENFGNGIDILIGGSPCQDLSIAKSNRQGLEGNRSGLFWEHVKVMKALKPKYFILENVASMPQKDKDIITEAIGVQPIMINAALVSAQRRKRLFWTNIPNVELPQDRGILLRDVIEVEVDEKYYVKDETVKKICQRLKDRKPLGQALRIHSIDGKSVTLSALGGGTGAKTGLYVINIDGTEQTKSKTLRTSGMGSGFGDKHNWDQIAIVTTPRGHNKGGVDFEKSPTLTKSSFEHNNHLVEMIENGIARVRRLTPMYSPRLQGTPDHFTEGYTDSQRYKMLGNAFNVDVIAHILSFIPIKRWRP
jgi:DNA (cytosine-5)-methyltransferase 3A